MTLPNFLIVGASKAGTTSLYHYLRQHPDVYMSPVKEPRYFTAEGEAEWAGSIHSREAYERLFDGVTSQKAIGEASPQYLNSLTAAERIATDLPGVRIIVLLRSPADRAYSSYLGRLASGDDSRGPEEALQPGTHYFETSLYYLRLSRYFERFDRSRIKVIVFDDLLSNKAAVMRELHEFLEIDTAFITDVTTRHNAARTPRSVMLNDISCRAWRMIRSLFPRMPATGLARRAHELMLRRPDPLPAVIRRRLLEQFRDDILKTATLIGRDLSAWLE